MCGPGRATFTPDYGRRGCVWVFGAFEPATGLATTLCSPRRDSASFIQLLELVLQAYPARQWVLVSDNLTTHVSRETQTCLVPGCAGVLYENLPSQEALGDSYYTGAPARQRHCVERYSLVKKV
jgi:hypothetical protein